MDLQRLALAAFQQAAAERSDWTRAEAHTRLLELARPGRLRDHDRRRLNRLADGYADLLARGRLI